MIDRITGKDSSYGQEAKRIIADGGIEGYILVRLIGILEAIAWDVENGFVDSVTELIHADVFGDFLEMAKHLTDTGYKDAGAVIAGSTLEAHISKLAEKNGVDLESGGKPKKTDGLNSEIAKNGGYGKLDQKNVTAWLDLRNKAAHGEYEEYDIQQVRLLVDAIRDFITRNPA